MAKPIVVEYRTSKEQAMKAIAVVISRLGYTLKSVDNKNGFVNFETGMSINSWAGQNMSVHFLETAGNGVQLTIGGSMKAHGAQMQVYDWGEARKIATKLIGELTPILGQGEIISAKPGSSDCFIATAAFGNPFTTEVESLRVLRDNVLMHQPAGRIFVSLYYRYSPPMALLVARSPILAALTRTTLRPIILLSRLIINQHVELHQALPGRKDDKV